MQWIGGTVPVAVTLPVADESVMTPCTPLPPTMPSSEIPIPAQLMAADDEEFLTVPLFCPTTPPATTPVKAPPLTVPPVWTLISWPPLLFWPTSRPTN